MTRKPLSPKAEAELQNAMRKFCDDVERRKADEEADKRAEAAGRIADILGANV